MNWALKVGGGGAELVEAVVVTIVIVMVTMAMYVSQHRVGNLYVISLFLKITMSSALVLVYVL